ncbi:MAG: Membrane protein, distant similarity to thiosulphate:quinone oxidoreductase DoxD [uncultured Sulfurovum sp.]|uniref:Membrane protein, distant similarity to thiosulphate:quinone oxidoreductase DoxD n=1 Tax=uncultured Sulfurovum sp. TaxID=269237 RepID=A0A6S6SED6_9BACT|nr:MAG: Membrane protein, distant similarity to thiosulphate:quinone oxidoreductase DoxD [uncultured Sulfurovum sp.]CAA6821128.1 MAG: Membrane protein, distant similarity to thiosulphate:quinone oxidoreductase DoxD [uncultured Sulfurovum sp.]
MQLKESYLELTVLLKYFESLSLLLARVALAYGFYNPSLLKWSNFESTSAWFGSLGIPFATLASFLVASIEILAVLLLLFGLFTRLIAIPLMVIMLVAILIVHIGHGFSVANNGFEIPLYYFLFLALFASFGAGKFSLDHLMFGKEK